MEAFQINGGRPLSGTVRVMGAKNAILPLMAAALLTDEAITLKNVSPLSDVKTLSALLTGMGAKIEQDGHTMTIRCHQMTSTTAPYEYVSKMRATFWVLGPLLGRFHQARVSLPGGCAIGARPVDLYLKAIEAMGVSVRIENGYVIAEGHLKPAEITFPKISVGATHNTIMAAVLTPGTTIIHNPALEPEVMDLIALLQKMGADIRGVGTRTLTITGVPKLNGAEHTVVSDRIETATFAAAAGVTHGRILIEGGEISLMQAVADSMTACGLNFTQTDTGLWVDATEAKLRATPVVTAEYPAFPTDAQPLLTTLLSLAEGESLVREQIYENRFMHVPELNRMGAHIQQIDNKTVLIHGVPTLSGATVTASDLRGGVALVLAGLAAQGQTIVQRIYHIDRGYSRIEEKLTALGADIIRFKQ